MLAFVTAAFENEPAVDTGVSHALLQAVAAGDQPPTFRLHRTRRIVAFGRQDRAAPGYAAAVERAAAAGYLPVERLAGGRAAVFHEGTLAFSWATPSVEPRSEIVARFVDVSTMLATALGELGLDARVGEVPGEYCPGAYSVNIGGMVKVVGIGQRLVRGAAHVGGVIVVDGGRRIADVLVPVYAALDIEWDPETAGDLSDHIPNVTFGDVERAVIAVLGRRTELVPATLDPTIAAEGRRLAAGHVASPTRTA